MSKIEARTDIDSEGLLLVSKSEPGNENSFAVAALPYRGAAWDLWLEELGSTPASLPTVL